ncbi:MAG: diaminopimelate decarboxylase, partial [Phycisphaerae bacterium]|nr:diaminopimelate decarboxylase [Phycisphaerae bacterium]
MDAFEYRNGALFCEDVAVADIAASAGTPAYVYSSATLREHYRRFAEAFGELDATICFSIKSLANLHVLAMLVELGSGFDVVSGGEIARARAAGADMSRVVFAGVGKTDRELGAAIDAGVGLFNVESEQEFETLARIATERGATVRAALRINPDVYDPKTHRYTTTGKKETKFGVDIDRAEAFFERFGRDDNVRLDAIDMHIGSPIYSAEPYVQAIDRALALIETLRGAGHEIRTLDIGGGYAADYVAGASPDAADYAAEIVPKLRGRDLQIILEPGRSVACNAGILLMRTLYTKQGGEKRFVIVDAAMTDMLRPALYGAEHFVWPAELAQGAEPPERRPDYAAPDGQTVDVVGGVCETSDTLAAGRTLPPMQRGDLLALFSAGAYG